MGTSAHSILVGIFAEKMAGTDRWTDEYDDAKQLADDTLALIQVRSELSTLRAFCCHIADVHPAET